MLAKGAFNSMLNTLEEPPEHLKFVLATTDPQKVPVTVLSRCLQFNLKPLPAPQIGARLAQILDAESIVHEQAGLALIARAAQGSLRDALSLLDQAIAYGGGEVREADVRTMLGLVERDYVYRIADALLAGDGTALLAQADGLVDRGVALDSALDDLAGLFHRIAVAQAVPQATADFDDRERIERYAAKWTPESVQLSYQICVQGREDLALAPDEATGFSMTLLRLLAFEPADSATSGSSEPRPAPAASPGPRVVPAAKAAPSNVASIRTPPARSRTEPAANAPAETAVMSASPRLALPGDGAGWPTFVGALRLTGMAAQLAAQTELKQIEGNVLTLALPATHRHLADKSYSDKLKVALEGATGRKLLLAFEVGEATDASLAAQEKRQRAEAQANGEQAFRDEPFVRDLIDRFDARVKPETIKPLPSEG